MDGKVVQQLKNADFQPAEVDGMAIFEAISNEKSLQVLTDGITRRSRIRKEGHL